MIDTAMVAWLFWVGVGALVFVIVGGVVLDFFFPIGKRRDR